jgi:hypothetical protein
MGHLVGLSTAAMMPFSLAARPIASLARLGESGEPIPLILD